MLGCLFNARLRLEANLQEQQISQVFVHNLANLSFLIYLLASCWEKLASRSSIMGGSKFRISQGGFMIMSIRGIGREVYNEINVCIIKMFMCCKTVIVCVD